MKSPCVFWKIMEEAKAVIGISENEFQAYGIKVNGENTTWDKDFKHVKTEFNISDIVIDELHMTIEELSKKSSISEGLHKFALLIRSMKQSALHDE